MPNHGLTDKDKQQDAGPDKERGLKAPNGPKRERSFDKKVGRSYEEAAKQQPQSPGQPAGGE
jgi:hypothetical protein